VEVLAGDGAAADLLFAGQVAAGLDLFVEVGLVFARRLRNRARRQRRRPQEGVLDLDRGAALRALRLGLGPHAELRLVELVSRLAVWTNHDHLAALLASTILEPTIRRRGVGRPRLIGSKHNTNCIRFRILGYHLDRKV